MDAEDDDPDAERRAIRKRAMDMLARREHAPAELAAKLRRREHDAETIDAVLDGLIDDGLLSAERYAAASVAAKSARGIGPVRIRAEMAAAGIDEPMIETAIEDAGVDWAVLADAVRRKRFGDGLPGDFAARAKQMRFLQRRGFAADHFRRLFAD